MNPDEYTDDALEAFDPLWRDLAARREAKAAALIGAVRCPGDHGAALPCPSCGAAL